jgi:hypothetical protein
MASTTATTTTMQPPPIDHDDHTETPTSDDIVSQSVRTNVEEKDTLEESSHRRRRCHSKKRVLADAATTASTTISTSSDDTVAIYISITPPIGTFDNNDHELQSQELHLYWNESYLHQLFETYGTIRNIYLYRHKKKNNQSKIHHKGGGGGGDDGYKGDGIIVYKILNTESPKNDDNSKQRQRQILIDLVCGQVCANIFPSWSIRHLHFQRCSNIRRLFLLFFVMLLGARSR